MKKESTLKEEFAIRLFTKFYDEMFDGGLITSRIDWNKNKEHRAIWMSIGEEAKNMVMEKIADYISSNADKNKNNKKEILK